MAYVSLATVGKAITAALFNLIAGYVNRQGMTGIIPTSVAGTGVVLNANGQITFTTATAINVNGCFTSAFDTYELHLNVTARSAASNSALRMRSAGTDITAANYNTVYHYGGGTTSTAATTTGGTGFVTDIGGVTLLRGKYTLFSPFLAAATGLVGQVALGSAEYIVHEAGNHTLATSYDGFTIYMPTNNFTGTLRIYGYNSLT
jgi:hypothetical protein